MPSPANLNFTQTASNPCIRGVTFRVVLTLYDDAAGTTESDLTGLDGRVRITDDAGAVLWEGTEVGDSVLIDVGDATVTIVIDAPTTDELTVGMHHIDIDLIDTSTDPDEVDRVAHGEFQVVK